MNTTNFPVLPLKKWRATIREFLENRDAEAKAKKAKEAARDSLKDAMAGAPEAVCGHYKLVATPVAGSVPGLKTKAGRVIALGELATITLRDGTTLTGADIASVSGARAAQERFDVKAA